jgi:hypothetical protein
MFISVDGSVISNNTTSSFNNSISAGSLMFLDVYVPIQENFCETH